MRFHPINLTDFFHFKSFLLKVSRTLDRIQASKKLLSNIDVDNYEGNDASSSSIYKKRILKVKLI